MKKDNFSKIILIVILLIAAFLRLWQLPEADVITDEAFYSLRSIGYIDFLMSESQKTPYDWYGTGELPAWLKLSFHDHPPLTFIIQHIFFKLGGVNLWSLRLPSALAGIASVFLMYLIGRQLFKAREKVQLLEKRLLFSWLNRGELVGFLAAGLLAINDYHVWVSRIGLHESIVIFFILLTIYLFLRALEKPIYFILTGFALGLALLSKYTAFVLLPIILLYLLIFRRDTFRDKYLYVGALITLILFSPVVFYNFKIYAARGHFDYQFSYRLLGQEAPEWQFRQFNLGRPQAESLNERLQGLLPAIWHGATPSFAMVTLLALLFIIYQLIRKSHNDNNDARSLWFLMISLLFYLLLFIAIGPRERFVSLIVPLLVFLVSYFLIEILSKIQRRHLFLWFFALMFFCFYELLFAYQTALTPEHHIGLEGITFSRLKFDSLAWGYNELDSYLEQELFANSYPALQLLTDYTFLENLKYEALTKAKKHGKKPVPILLIFDENIASAPRAWYIFRHFVYEAWPTLFVEDYLQELESKGSDFFHEQGFQQIYFIKTTSNTLLRQDERIISPDKLEERLTEQGIHPKIILNERIGEAFKIYKFDTAINSSVEILAING